MTKSEQLEIAIKALQREIVNHMTSMQNEKACEYAIQVLKDKIKELETKED